MSNFIIHTAHTLGQTDRSLGPVGVGKKLIARAGRRLFRDSPHSYSCSYFRLGRDLPKVSGGGASGGGLPKVSGGSASGSGLPKISGGGASGGAAASMASFLGRDSPNVSGGGAPFAAPEDMLNELLGVGSVPVLSGGY